MSSVEDSHVKKLFVPQPVCGILELKFRIGTEDKIRGNSA